MSNKIRPKQFALIATITVLCIENAAAEWELDPMIRAAWDYDDNAALSIRTDQEEELSGFIGEVSVDFRNNGEKGFFSLRPRFRTRNYGSDSNRDSDDDFLDLRAGYTGVRNSFRFFANYARESVRTAELADAELNTDIDPDDISDDDSGRVRSRERRERVRVTPRWAYKISDVSSLEADINFLTVDYSEEQVSSTLFDYTDTRLRLTYRRKFSSRNTGLVTLTGRDYTTERVNGDRTGFGIAAGFNRSLSETVEFRALFGVEETNREDTGVPGASDDPNFVTDISLTRRLETIRLLAQYRQRVAPSGRGELITRNEFNLRFTRDLNDRFTAGLGVRAYTVDSVDGITNEQDYVQLRGQLIWRLTETFYIQTDYRHTVLNREFFGEGADSDRVTMWFTYQPNSRGRGRQSFTR